MTNYLKNIFSAKENSKPIKPTQQIFSEIFSFAKAEGIDINNKLFQAELYNTTTKASAEAYFAENLESSNIFKTLTQVAEKIKHTSTSDQEASEKFRDVISQFNKKFTFTPHPDFVIMKDGMFASRQLKELYAQPELVEYLAGEISFSDLSDKAKTKFSKTLKNLFTKITDYPTKNLTPKEESAMLVKNSENVFDSSVIILDMLDSIHEKSFGRKMTPLERAEISLSSLLVWRDQDSKPDVTANRISHSDEVTSKNGMHQLYALIVSDIMKDLSPESEGYKSLQTIVVKSLNTFDNPVVATVDNRQVFVADEAEKYKRAAQELDAEKGSEGAKEDRKALRKDFLQRYFPNLNKYLNRLPSAQEKDRPYVSDETIKILKDSHSVRIDNLRSEDHHGFSSSKEMYNDLTNILKDTNLDLPYETQIKIANLASQAKSYGLRALVSENRQNKDELNSCFDFLKSKMIDSKTLNGVITEDDNVQTILEKSQTDSRISQFTRDLLLGSRDFFDDIEIKLKAGLEISDADRHKYLMLDVLYTREYYSNLGDSERSMVIAESESADNLRTAVLFEDLTRSPVNRNSKVTELKFLFENRPDILNSPQIIAEVLNDKILSQYQKKTYETPQIIDPQTGEKRNKTMADVKREKGFKNITEEDKKTDVKGKITIMFAGSDSMKGLGLSAKFLIEYSKYQIAKQAAALGYEVEFKRGNGPNPARDSSENLDADQTVQGIETNNSPMNFAYRTLNYVAHKVGQMFSVKPEKQKGEIDFGNQKFSKPDFEDFENNPKRAQEIYTHLKDNVSVEYGNLYEKGIGGNDKKNLLDGMFEVGTLSKFTGFTSLSSRGLGRINSAPSVLKTRAIGFANAQAALINSLVYSIDQMIDGGKKSAKQAYQDCKDFSIYHETFFNQATFGVMSASMELQWKLVDADFERVKKNGSVYIKIGDKEYSTSRLAKMDSDIRYEIKSIIESKYKGTETPITTTEKIMDSIFIAANMDRKYALAEKHMFNLYKEYALDNGLISEREYNSKQQTTREQILKFMPKEAADSIKFIQQNCAEAIKNLSSLSQSIKEEKLQNPKKTKDGLVDPSNLFGKIFENIGAIMAYHEHTPASLEIKGKTIDLQKQINLQPQKMVA